MIGDFAFNGEGSCFCSTVTGLLGRTALGAKKIGKFHDWEAAKELQRAQQKNQLVKDD